MNHRQADIFSATADVVDAFDSPTYVAQTGEIYLMTVKDDLMAAVQGASTVDQTLSILESYLPARTL